jgi:hypothetical protein
MLFSGSDGSEASLCPCNLALNSHEHRERIVRLFPSPSSSPTSDLRAVFTPICSFLSPSLVSPCSSPSPLLLRHSLGFCLAKLSDAPLRMYSSSHSTHANKPHAGFHKTPREKPPDSQRTVDDDANPGMGKLGQAPLEHTSTSQAIRHMLPAPHSISSPCLVHRPTPCAWQQGRIV